MVDGARTGVGEPTLSTDERMTRQPPSHTSTPAPLPGTAPSPFATDSPDAPRIGQQQGLLFGLGMLLSMLVAVAIIAAVPKFGVLFTVLAEELPLATRLALTLYPLSACLPLLVVLSWFAWPRPASRGRAALLTGLACLLLAPLLVGAALYLPLLQMGALI